MKTLVIDTHRVVEVLQQKGFTKDQAEGLIDAAREADLSEFATRTDINELRIELYKVTAAQTFIIIGAMIALAVV